MRSVGILFILALAGCPRVCENAQTRCDGNAVQICTSRGRWQLLFDCKEVRTKDGKVQPGTCVVPPKCAPVTP